MSGFRDDFVTIHQGDAWELAATLDQQSVNCIVTSPPYWGLRDYGEPGQFGLEPTHDVSPFAGIGSEGYVALKTARKFVGVELKISYFDVATKNLKAAEIESKSGTLLDLLDDAS